MKFAPAYKQNNMKSRIYVIAKSLTLRLVKMLGLEKIGFLFTNYLKSLNKVERCVLLIVTPLSLIASFNYASQVRLLENPIGLYRLAKLNGYQQAVFRYAHDYYLAKYKHEFLEDIKNNGEEIKWNSPIRGRASLDLLKFMLKTDRIRKELISELNSFPKELKLHPASVLMWHSFDGIIPVFFAYKYGGKQGDVFRIIKNTQESRFSLRYDYDFLNDTYWSLNKGCRVEWDDWDADRVFSKSYIDWSNANEDNFSHEDLFEAYSKNAHYPGSIFVEPAAWRRKIPREASNEGTDILRKNSMSFRTLRPYKSLTDLVRQYEMLEKCIPELSPIFQEIRKASFTGESLYYYADYNNKYYGITGYNKNLLVGYFEAAITYIFRPVLLSILFVTIVPFFSIKLLAWLISFLLTWVKKGTKA
jgi:hypothetical protein